MLYQMINISCHIKHQNVRYKIKYLNIYFKLIEKKKEIIYKNIISFE